MFVPEDTCDNVHSQSRRMLMVSPEPSFWIHAVSVIGGLPSPLYLRVDSECADMLLLVHRAGKEATLPGLGQRKGQGWGKDRGQEQRWGR